MELDYSRAIPVQNIPQEYAFIAAQRCPCTGRLEVTRQALVFHAGQPYDLLFAVCQRCGQEHRFLFDIRSFFGK